MKKIYLFAIIAVAMVFNANAQFTDDIESYALGPVFEGPWTTWDGTNDGTQNAIVSTDQANSGSQSIFIGPSSGGQDAILDLGGVATSGIWSLRFKMYVPAGNTGYFNIQGNVDPSANDNLEFLSSDITLVAGTLTDDNEGNTGTYPESTWFDVVIEVDVDNQTYDIRLDGNSIGVQAFNDTAITQFGGLDLFADVATNTYYVDDVEFVSGVLGTDDFTSETFKVYPNPVRDVLNIESANAVSEIVVYDVLGKAVLQARPDRISPTIDMSGLASGAYMVRVTINGASKTIKVVK